VANKRKASAARPDGVPDEVWAEAVSRAAVVAPLAAEDRLTRARVRDAARTLGLSVPSAYRLIALYRQNPVTASLVPHRPGPARGTRHLPPGVESIVEGAIEVVHEQPERPTLALLQPHVKQGCKAVGLKPPSRKALSARVSARSLRETVRAREGAEAARQRFAPVRPGPRPSLPLRLVQADHTRVDLVLVDAATRAPLGRPWLTLVLDVCTRCVLGLHVAFDTPSSAGVALAVAQAVLPKEAWLVLRRIRLAWPMHGLPGILHLDNAREFRARALRLGCQQHGIRVEYRPPATPRFGGHIERLMGTLMGRVHALPGTTFSNVAERGDYPSERRAVLSLAEFERVLALEVLGPYHNDVHSALGKTPAAAWAEGIASVQPRLPRDQDAFVLDFLPWEERVVRRDGVHLFRIAYYDGALASLIGEPDRKVRVRYDPRDLGAVFVELPEGGHVRVPYADLARPPISLWEHQEAVRRLREAGRRTVDEHAIFEAVDEQRRILAEAGAATKAARRSERSATSLALHPAPVGPASALISAAASASPDGEDEEARVPVVVEDEAWKTEFLP